MIKSSPFLLGWNLFRCAVALLLLAGVRPAPAAPPITPLVLRLTGTDTEGRQNFDLEWSAVSNALYVLQWRANLEGDSSAWQSMDAQAPAGGRGVFKITPDKSEANSESLNRGFFQVQLPPPRILRLEPAFLSTNGGVVTLVGQCLATNGQLRVNGLVLSPNVLQPGTVYSFTLPPLPEGTYDMEWLEGGLLVDTAEKLFSVTAEVQPVGVTQRLLEPPVEPPASPMKVKNGGMVNGAININHGNRMSGKKGLNAVNVKLARTINSGSGGGSSDGEDEVIAPTGEFQLQAVDLVAPGRGLDFVWTRTYRSRTGRTTPMGVNWDHSYNLFVEQVGTNVAVNDGTGRRDVYFLGTNGLYTRNEFFNEGSLSSNAFTLTFPDTGRWEFHEFDGSATAGKIRRIVDRNSNTLTFYHTIDGQLLTILDTLGRTNYLSYSNGFVSSVTDYSGRVVTFGYAPVRPGVTPAGVLVAVTSPAVTNTPNGNDFPAGKTTRYNYTSGFADERLNRNLASITDPKNQTWLQIFYRTNINPSSPAFDTLDYVQRGGYRTHLRRFLQTPSPENGFAVVKCIVKDGVGNVTELFYDAQNRCVRQLEYTGRAIPDLPTTEQANRPGKKLRDSDPDFFETRWSWNLDSLCTLVTEPRGNSTEVIHQRAFNQNSSRSNNAKRHDGDVRVVRERACCSGADTDGDGLSDMTERVWRFEYDSRFGSPALSRKGYQYYKSQSDLRSAGAHSNPYFHENNMAGSMPSVHRGGNMQGENPLFESARFATVLTDPRGGSDLCTYDARGNLLQHQGPQPAGGQRPVTDWEYNAFGQPTVCVLPLDGNGERRRDECVYYDSGVQNGYLHKRVADCLAAHLHLTNTFEYDARGNVTRHLDPRGFDTLWTYNALDQVTTCTTPATSFGGLVRCTTAFTHDANDNLVQTDQENRDETGALDAINPQWTSFAEFDALNRRTLVAHELTHVVQQRSLTNRFFYDGNDNLMLLQKPEAVSGADPNNVVSYLFDERDLPFQITHAPGVGLTVTCTEQFDYNPNGQCARVSKIDSFSIKQTTRVHDGFDRCVQAIDPMGNVDFYAYDRNDNLVLHRVLGETNDVLGGVGNRRLSETRHEYDALDRPVRSRVSFFDVFTELSIGDGESTHSRTFSDNGLLLSETDDNGRTTRYAYDTAHRLSSITDPRTNITVHARDRAGNITSTTLIDRSDVVSTEQTFITTFKYDGWNRCVSSSNNAGNVELFGYDSRNNCVSAIDARGNETFRVFDGLGRCTDTTQYVGKERGITINTTHHEYGNNRCLSQTDGNGHTTSYAYDSLDRVVLTTLADGTTESLVWSPRSNVSQRTDANSTMTAYTYDLNDRCVRKDIAVAPGVAETTTFEEFAYDGLSRLVLGTNNTSMVEFSYDSMSNIEKMKADCLAAFATFDGEGNRLSLQYPGGRVIHSTFNGNNRTASLLVSATPGGSATGLSTYAYEGADRVTKITRANGINTRIFYDGVSGVANAQGDRGWRQMRRINHQAAGGGAVIADRTLGYDAGQNKASVVGGALPGGAILSSALSYDAGDRLTSVVVTAGGAPVRQTGYQLDRLGNRQAVIQNGAVGTYGMDSTLPEPADAQMNQYTFTPFGAEQHDRNGNLVLRDSGAGPTLYHYDYADRLVSVERTVGPALVTVVSFNYDVLGRRISKTTYPPAPSLPVTTQFLHDPDSDGDEIIEERENGVTKLFAVWPHMHQVASHVRISAAGETTYAHADDLGNVLALTDAGGNVLERYLYDDYGQPQFLAPNGTPLVDGSGLPVTSSPAGNPFLFHGMYWDGETALYRGHGGSGENPLYDPKTGRYLSRSHREVSGYRGWSGACAGEAASTSAGNNPGTAGDGSHKSATLNVSATPGGNVTAMKTGTVKFFNEAKSFGRMAAGGGKLDVLFNPKEYTVRKVTVRGWNPEKKEEFTSPAETYLLKKEEGGRHTPFQNKYCPQFSLRTTDVTGEIELEACRQMTTGLDVEYRFYGPGQAHWGSAMTRWGHNSASSIISNVLKTKHDTAKNSVGNIR